MHNEALQLSQSEIANFCVRHHILQLAFLGSVLRDDFGPESDVDVLVEFEPGCHPGWDIVEVEEELSKLFGGHRVDLVNPKYLKPHLKDRILADAIVQYDASGGTECFGFQMTTLRGRLRSETSRTSAFPSATWERVNE